VPADALFVLIGGEPCTQWLPKAVQLEGGYILTGTDIDQDSSTVSRWPLDRAPLPLETSVPGVFAAGDVRYKSIKRVASAVGDGATAVRIAHEYLAAGPAARLAELSRPAAVERPAGESGSGVSSSAEPAPGWGS
jgi:thioredoxin reductase (NADPH)